MKKLKYILLAAVIVMLGMQFSTIKENAHEFWKSERSDPFKMTTSEIKQKVHGGYTSLIQSRYVKGVGDFLKTKPSELKQKVHSGYTSLIQSRYVKGAGSFLNKCCASLTETKEVVSSYVDRTLHSSLITVPQISNINDDSKYISDALTQYDSEIIAYHNHGRFVLLPNEAVAVDEHQQPMEPCCPLLNTDKFSSNECTPCILQNCSTPCYKEGIGFFIPYCNFLPCDAPYLESCGLSLRFAGTIGKGIGINRDYSTVNLRAVKTWCCRELFLDAKWHCFSDRKNGANAGLGIRYTNDCSQSLLGANISYDFREGKYRNFHQISGGLEFFNPCYRFYINGYFPLNKKGCKNCCYFFDDNYYLSIDCCQYTMRGADAEFDKILFCCCNTRIIGGVGIYYYDDSQNDRTVGGRLRLTAEISKYLSFDLEGTYDKMFHTRVNGTLSLNFPFPSMGGRRSCNPCCQPCWCPPIPQRRNDIIVLRKCNHIDANFDYCGCGCQSE